jgi:hypothetical protein
LAASNAIAELAIAISSVVTLSAIKGIERKSVFKAFYEQSQITATIFSSFEYTFHIMKNERQINALAGVICHCSAANRMIRLCQVRTA